MDLRVVVILVFHLVTTISSTQDSRTLITFNAGLTKRILNKDIRASNVQEHLISHRSDVICLQEYWYRNDVERLTKTLQSTYPFSFSAVHRSIADFQHRTDHAACNEDLLNGVLYRMKVAGCLETRSEIATLFCAFKSAKLMDLPQECLSCIALSGIKRVYSDCVGPTSGGINIPGLVLLSKRPLRNIRKVDLIPGIKQILPRSYLYAEVDGIGPVACTHLTANLGKIYYEPYLQNKFSSWRDQNLHDVQTLVQDFRDYPRMIIMGDLNCGPSVPEQNVAEDFSASFQALMDNNFTAPYVTKLGMCTYCHENKFVVQNENLIIDHIILKGFEAKSVKRIFHNLLNGKDYPMSDHYGVEVTIGL